ncbi:MAG: DNA polymerase III subunit delta', partial [Spongiibacteraceae bacterium]
MQEKLLPTHLPWQLSRWSQLCELVESKRLPQSLLLSGPEAIGKQRFAEAFSAYLLCRSPSALAACGQCKSCGYFLAGSHPDYQLVAPLEGKRQIAVDQLRAVKSFAEQSAHYEGGRKVIVIQPAEAMNHFAANALLKTLEEPTANTYLVLVSNASAKLLPTIRSRCIQYTFGVPDAEQAKNWLANYINDADERDHLFAEAGGRPLLARQLHEQDGLGLRRQLDAGMQKLAAGEVSPLALAETYQEHDTLLFL